MLFSGGIDSTALYIKLRDLKPTLYSIIGGQIPVENRAFVRGFKQVYSDFAERDDVKIHFIETDLRDVLNEALLWSDKHEHLKYPWWEAINQAIVHISLSAPLTAGEIMCLHIASSDYRGPLDQSSYGTHPYIDGELRWGDIKVLYEPLRYNRQEKINHQIKRFIEEIGTHPKLQVCYYNPLISDKFNCCYCEKCSRTITGLLAAGIDPEKCGLEVREGLYNHIKEDTITQAYAHSNSHLWTKMQDLINLEDNDFHHNSEEFLRWLKDADLEALNSPEKGIDLEEVLLPIQARLPRVPQQKILQTYYKWKYSG